VCSSFSKSYTQKDLAPKRRESSFLWEGLPSPVAVTITVPVPSCRLTPVCSAWPSTPTSATLSTPTGVPNCTVARDVMKCHPISLPSLTVLMSTCWPVSTTFYGGAAKFGRLWMQDSLIAVFRVRCVNALFYCNTRYISEIVVCYNFHCFIWLRKVWYVFMSVMALKYCFVIIIR
jgi:hypothetical protein